MMVALWVVGAGLVLAGLAAIGLGIPYKEFSVGSTLIMAGVTGVCTGAIVLAIAVAVRELQNIARRLGTVAAGAPELPLPAPAISPRSPGEIPFPSQRDPHAVAPPPLAPSSPASSARPPWHEEIASRGSPGEVPSPAPAGAAPDAPPAPPKRRNLLFSSTSRKERERTQTRTAEPLPPDLLAPELRPNPAEAGESSPATFDDAWPKAERPRSVDVAPRRGARTPSTFGEAQAAPPSAAPPSPGHPPAPQEQPPVTVLKSGVVDGMAYSLYSDGSIEAQMPEGMMRFASIDELRSHLEQRP
ncbi:MULTISPECIES: DUF308 domain-containing protein [unclassified Bradyrhizobium]|uniref:DUF308 domain-containing protein n=1 Tax=unclassified Bradyrhizobium TaxID=2631580 RepID=UPI00247B0F80|nr:MULTISPECIES: DUF308 domain-containing protein [unclassified Bradyrhizobium]WGS18335.1 DUF308 domain-containing protein [Bradyrhizobium sp. ISRA463]WGS25150.1 DUF308 domain-containing protein [Bradyrhizobium sp. ISRA464]